MAVAGRAPRARTRPAGTFSSAPQRKYYNRSASFAYLGRNSRTFGADELQRDILRVGGDASVWWRRLNLYGVYLFGSSESTVKRPVELAGTTASFNGGFLQGDYHFNDWIAVTIRGNVLNPPGDGDTITSVFPGVQVWILRRLSCRAVRLPGATRHGGAVQLYLRLTERASGSIPGAVSTRASLVPHLP